MKGINLGASPEPCSAASCGVWNPKGNQGNIPIIPRRKIDNNDISINSMMA
jgi:hypothetical protein